MNKKTLFTFTLSALLFLSFQSPLYSAVYKWLDEDGQIHYGDQPQQLNAEKINICTNETTKHRQINNTDKQADKKPEADKPGNESGEKTGEQAEQPEQVAIPKKEKRRLCNEAKSDIAAISSRGRVRERNARGEYSFLSEKQRQQRLAAARKKQREYCR